MNVVLGRQILKIAEIYKKELSKIVSQLDDLTKRAKYIRNAYTRVLGVIEFT